MLKIHLGQMYSKNIGCTLLTSEELFIFSQEIWNNNRSVSSLEAVTIEGLLFKKELVVDWSCTDAQLQSLTK